MDYKGITRSLIYKTAALMLALAMVLASVLPAAEISAYAAAEEKPQTVQEPEVRPEATTISNYSNSFNSCRDEDLIITADITPADGRDVQLQRYNSTDSTWATITTVKAVPAPEPPAEETAAKEETPEKDAETPVTAEVRPADTNTVQVSISVPSEERMKTSSVWRIYVPATDKASAAVSGNISITTRNVEDIDLSARSACIYRITPDGKGYMIYSRNANAEVAQASTTKLMTAVVLLESGLIDSTTQISAYAASTPYASGRLAAGDVYNTRDLLYAMLLPSSNDAATAVAERVGGTEEGFVNMMNAKAAQMGLTSTHFRNPHGLDADGHYTTALELAKLTAYAYTFPEIRECWATQYKTIRSLEKKRKWTMWSTNAIFSYVSNFLGGKTGTESNAGCCFTGVYTHGGSTYVTVVLGSGYGFSRWRDTKKLHKYIQDHADSFY